MERDTWIELGSSAVQMGRAQRGLLKIWLIILAGVFSIGSGPGYYHILIYGDYYIIRGGGNHFSLERMVPPTSDDDASWMFTVILDDIATYGNTGEIIYGTTTGGDYYLLNPERPIAIFRERQQWVSALAEHRISAFVLRTPSPPKIDEQPRMSKSVLLLVASIGAICACLLLILILTSRKRGVAAQPLGNGGC